MTFSIFNNILISVKRSNFTMVFFYIYANSGAGRNFAGSSLYISRNILLSCQILRLTIMYEYEYKNHDILPILLFQNL